jgi:hypothetical protein
MSTNAFILEQTANFRRANLLAEASHDRLIDAATSATTSFNPIRAMSQRLAAGLHAVAARLDSGYISERASSTRTILA